MFPCAGSHQGTGEIWQGIFSLDIMEKPSPNPFKLLLWFFWQRRQFPCETGRILPLCYHPMMSWAQSNLLKRRMQQAKRNGQKENTGSLWPNDGKNNEKSRKTIGCFPPCRGVWISTNMSCWSNGNCCMCCSFLWRQRETKQSRAKVPKCHFWWKQPLQMVHQMLFNWQLSLKTRWTGVQGHLFLAIFTSTKMGAFQIKMNDPGPQFTLWSPPPKTNMNTGVCNIVIFAVWRRGFLIQWMFVWLRQQLNMVLCCTLQRWYQLPWNTYFAFLPFYASIL